MSLLNQAQNYDNSAAAVDMTNPSTGGGERKVLPAGKALVRFSSYIEYGTQLMQKYGTEEKEPKRVFRLGFKVVGGTGENEAGERVPFTDGQFFPHISTFDTPLSTHEKSKAIKLFTSMNYKKTARSFPALLGQLYLVDIKHDMKNGKVVAKADWTTLTKPVDPMTGSMYPAPELADEHYQLFLWDAPTTEQWKSIFIEGTTDDGKSKNYIQERIMGAQDFEGSRLEALLNGVELPTLVAQEEPVEEIDEDVPPFDVDVPAV